MSTKFWMHHWNLTNSKWYRNLILSKIINFDQGWDFCTNLPPKCFWRQQLACQLATSSIAFKFRHFDLGERFPSLKKLDRRQKQWRFIFGTAYFKTIWSSRFKKSFRRDFVAFTKIGSIFYVKHFWLRCGSPAGITKSRLSKTIYVDRDRKSSMAQLWFEQFWRARFVIK